VLFADVGYEISLHGDSYAHYAKEIAKGVVITPPEIFNQADVVDAWIQLCGHANLLCKSGTQE
jgi:hypothetical protein